MSNPYSAVIDADVLSKTLHRHILLNLAAAGCFKPIWSDTILQEVDSTIKEMGFDGAKRRAQLENAFPDALADTGYIHLVRQFQMKDENDRHVVAVALQEGADAICTDNIRDFGLSVVDVFDADEFIANTIDLTPVRAIDALAEMRSGMTSVSSGSEFVELIESRGLIQTAEYLKQYVDRL